MARYKLFDTRIMLSKAAYQTFNVIPSLAADFVGARVDSGMPPFPEVQRIPDGMIGDGTPRAQKLRNGWLIPRTLALGGRLNTETALRLGMRALGGVNTNTPVTATSSYDVFTTCPGIVNGLVPKMSACAYYLGGYDFIWPSMAVTRYTISFANTDNVNFAADLVNTGFYGNISTLSAGAGVLTPSNIPAPPTHHLMHPAGTRVTFSNGLTIDFANTGDLISGNCSIDNAIEIPQGPGDPFFNATNRASGAYARQLNYGERAPAAQLKVALRSDLQQFVLAQNNTDITNLTYLFQGEDKITGTSDYYEYEWTYPVAQIETVTGEAEGNDAATVMTFYPKLDPGTGSYINQRARTDNNTIS